MNEAKEPNDSRRNEPEEPVASEPRDSVPDPKDSAADQPEDSVIEELDEAVKNGPEDSATDCADDSVPGELTESNTSPENGSVTKGPNDSITLVLRKTHVYVVAALIIGLTGGFGIAKAFFDSSTADGVVSGSQQVGLQTVRPVPTTVGQASNAIARQPNLVQIPVAGRPFSGPEDAPVTLVEFSDYQCPFCARHFQQTLPQLLSNYDGKIKYVVFNFPISTIHPLAQKASEAAECAYDQGKFWEYHDLLFNNQQALDTASLKGYATTLGLNNDNFNNCLDSGEKTQQVLSDFQTGQNAGVRGTPTFFINGRQLVGAQPLASFTNIIDAALAQ